jgi:hypothetical protein
MERAQMKMHQPPKLEEPDMRAIKAEAKTRFGNLSGVQGFGVGDHTLRIYVSNSGLRTQLPAKFHGVPIDVVVTGEIVAR